MSEAWTISTIIDRALEIEEQSYTLYNSAIDKAEGEEVKAFLRELADLEQEHKAKLLAVKNIKDRPEELEKFIRNMPKVQDLKIVDYLEDRSLLEPSYFEYQKFLIYAGKREKATYEYYEDLAKKLGESEAGKLFARLAAEELTHKKKIEEEYEKYILHED